MTNQPDLLAPPAPKEPKRLLNAGDIRKGMLARWCAPEYAIMWEVATATGAVSRVRYADAVIMSLWPSRGLELHGVEIKVSRSDWKREAADPAKAEAIAAYCDRWWIHTTPNVVQDASELPPAWGLREFDGTKWRTIKEAAATTAKPMDRQFLASLLRRADEGQRQDTYRAAEAMIAADREAYQKRIDGEVAHRTRGYEAASKQIADFEEASGIKMTDFISRLDARRTGALVKLISELGLDTTWAGLPAIRKAAADTVERMDRVMAESGLDFTPPPAVDTILKRKRR